MLRPPMSEVKMLSSLGSAGARIGATMAGALTSAVGLPAANVSLYRAPVANVSRGRLFFWTFT
eukprot:10795109-Heterocapsa_arctica.AAC.1